MWIFITTVVIVALVIANFVGYVDGKRGKSTTRGIVFMLTGVLIFFSLDQAKKIGLNESKIVGEGDYYEVIVTAPTPDGRTLVYAIGLDGNKEKVGILAEYPMEGYKFEQAGKRTFLVPQNAHIAFGKEGDIIIVSDDGEAFNVPPFSTGGK